jgi:hypothetical protein
LNSIDLRKYFCEEVVSNDQPDTNRQMRLFEAWGRIFSSSVPFPTRRVGAFPIILVGQVLKRYVPRIARSLFMRTPIFAALGLSASGYRMVRQVEWLGIGMCVLIGFIFLVVDYSIGALTLGLPFSIFERGTDGLSFMEFWYLSCSCFKACMVSVLTYVSLTVVSNWSLLLSAVLNQVSGLLDQGYILWSGPFLLEMIHWTFGSIKTWFMTLFNHNPGFDPLPLDGDGAIIPDRVVVPNWILCTTLALATFVVLQWLLQPSAVPETVWNLVPQ